MSKSTTCIAAKRIWHVFLILSSIAAVRPGRADERILVPTVGTSAGPKAACRAPVLKPPAKTRSR